ncbi:hypothetical protein QAD02_007286 [Eretmocerus hayati]|uniref:Uncharacterized protein n=1 Tax=Eretmocerus hayati TaxID=131215 RepID=A0ACC2N3J0_9HYME|nr:hypothetical protein QAD02_007286 [Eretmocerus hayati]
MPPKLRPELRNNTNNANDSSIQNMQNINNYFQTRSSSRATPPTPSMTLDERLEAMMKRLKFLEEREENRYKRDKESNLHIRGLQLNANDREQEVSNFLADKLKVEVGIDKVSTFKTAKGSQLVIVRVSSFEQKKLVIKSRTNLVDPHISITSNRTEKERETQENLNSIADDLRGEGKNVTVGYRTLIVDGIVEYPDKNERLTTRRSATRSPTRTPSNNKPSPTKKSNNSFSTPDQISQ